MKKYWKMTVTIIVIIVSIGSFYLTNKVAADQNPDVTIETTSGDMAEIKSLVLDGSFFDSSSKSSTQVKITAEGTNRNNNSFLNRLIGNPPTVIKDLRQKNRNFMRGKDPIENLFFENDQFLAYANVSYQTSGSLQSYNYQFDISILNKEESKTDSFKLQVPNQTMVEHVLMEDVQIIGGELKLITQNMTRDNGVNNTEQHVYTVDIASQQISGDEAVLKLPEDQGDTQMNAQLIQTSPLQDDENLIFMVTESSIKKDLESTRFESVQKEMVTYNLLTKETTSIELPEDIQTTDNQASFYDGEMIYFVKTEGGKLIVTSLNQESGKEDTSFEIELPYKLKDQNPPLMTIDNGKVYVATRSMNQNQKAFVVAVDTQTGKLLYSGELAVTSAEEMEEYVLYLYELSVK
ncbi:hypothetical protein [Aquibacillus salsiterrae]|uniref:Uncharacterized protein n=1 Tax=Aquibacillus salsiterrae TaxID=2950439 RepID=A0A9X4AHF3_9BACI|nr:hypothetical protein [Aquibacillus salsiterrae]MDC3418255.1 hypothetical protein [Aquibacillus salsiterrae]